MQLPQNHLSPLNIKTSENAKIFIWKSLHGVLPVGEQFPIRNIPVTTLCSRRNAVESVTHLPFNCPYATKIWELALVTSAIRANAFTSTREGWETVSLSSKREISHLKRLCKRQSLTLENGCWLKPLQVLFLRNVDQN